MKRFLIALLILGSLAAYIAGRAVDQVRAAQYAHAVAIEEATK